MSSIQFKIIPHRLEFTFQAGTSRGILKHKDTWFLKVWEKGNPSIFGIGECSPLPGLSIDYKENYFSVLEKICQEKFEGMNSIPSGSEVKSLVASLGVEYPSIAFGMEMALFDLLNGGKRKFMDNDFFDHHQPISINGLVWMGDQDFMLQQVDEKLKTGFNCIKIKVGAIQFDQELEVIQHIRKKFSKDEITIRLDANGAFSEKNVFKILDQYAALDIHSIEQPVKQGQWDLMQKVCRESPIPVALDEELIGVENKDELLQEIKPQFIILKPSLLGGIDASMDWVNRAEKLNIGWWMTSLLESNIGLNAIAQLTSHLKTTMPQGLGTGQLYHNNIPSPLEIRRGNILLNSNLDWDLQLLG